jgi:hypothetical protein
LISHIRRGRFTKGSETKSIYDTVYYRTLRKIAMRAFIIRALHLEVCSKHGENKKCIKILAEIFERKRPLETPRRKWEDCVKIDLT